MTIHKSKGLEFPIVILADLSKDFNKVDLQAPVLVHPELGLGPLYIDLERHIRYSTAARQAVAQRMSRELRAEEMRVLYVAMTRPKEKLILVDAMYHGESRLQKLCAMASCPVLPETVAACRTFGDWLLLALLCRPEAAPLRAFAGAETPEACTVDGASWQVFVHDGRDFQIPAPLPRKRAAEERTGDFDSGLLEFTYPYGRETRLPAKITATQLKGRALDEEIAENAARSPYLRPLSQPKFRRESHGLTPAERGTAIHLVLQYLDFGNMDAAAQVASLAERALLTPEQAAAVEIPALERFLASPLAEEIRCGENVLREYRFTLLMEARAYDPQASAEDAMLLQGVVDCCFETAAGLTVVDFKTDRVETAEEIRSRAEHYRPQLEAYSRALEQVLERSVVRRVLYFLHPGVTVEV